MFFNKSWFWLIALPGFALMAIYNFSPDIVRADAICKAGLVILWFMIFAHGIKYYIES